MNGGKWLSKAGVLWALDEAEKVPARLVSALVAVARYAGEDGRGAHPSAETIALHIRKTRRQARRDLDDLEALGLLLPGDQRIVAHIRADRRPPVYDLAMPRGDTGVPPSGRHGGTPMARRGDMQGRHGGSPMTPEEVLKTSGTARGRARAGGSSAGAQETFRAPPCPECGQPFSQEQLADPDFRAMALAGDAIHPECDGRAAPQHACRRCTEWAENWDEVTGLCDRCRASPEDGQ